MQLWPQLPAFPRLSLNEATFPPCEKFAVKFGLLEAFAWIINFLHFSPA